MKTDLLEYKNVLKDQIRYWEEEVVRRKDNKYYSQWKITLAERKVKLLNNQLVKLKN